MSLNIIVYQRKKKLQTLLSTPGPEIRLLEIATFFNKIQDIPSDSYVVISGTTPKGMDENFFAQLITTLRGKGVKVFLDADEGTLKRGVNAGPYLIKPNIHEFGRLVEKNIMDIDEILENAKPYKNVVEYIVVSMGVRGVIGISKNGNYHVIPPKVKVRSSAGAGDSLLAGIVFILNIGESFEDALILGVACGTAPTLNPGNNLCTKEDVDMIKEDVVVKNF